MDGEQTELVEQKTPGINNGIPRVSFWVTYPDAIIVSIFRELKQRRGDEKSSDLMWYIHCMMDPENKFMQALPKDERRGELQKYYHINGNDLKGEIFKKSAEWYKKYWITAPRRMLNALREKLFESQKLIEDHELKKTDDIMYFADMQEAYSRFKKAYEEAENSFKAEGPIKRKLGGEAISAADDGSLFELL